MASEIEKEKHRKHLKYKIKERRQRSEIAKRLLVDPQYRQQRTKRKDESEERAFKKYKRFETDEGDDVL